MPTEGTTRRRLYALGYRLEKNRSRNFNHPFYGRYIVVDLHGGGIVLGGEYGLIYTASLADVEEWLAEIENSATA